MPETKRHIPNEDIERKKPAEQADNSRKTADKELLEKAAAGDQEAFAELFKKYNPDLKNFINSKTFLKSEAEDTVQTAWANVLAKVDDIKDNFKNYLFTTALNVFRMKLKRRENKVMTEEYNEEKHESSEDSETLTKNIDRKNTRARLAKIISASTEKKENKAILRLWLEGNSYKEMAEQLGLNVNTVKLRIFYIKKRLKPAIEEAGLSLDIFD